MTAGPSAQAGPASRRGMFLVAYRIRRPNQAIDIGVRADMPIKRRRLILLSLTCSRPRSGGTEAIPRRGRFSGATTRPFILTVPNTSTGNGQPDVHPLRRPLWRERVSGRRMQVGVAGRVVRTARQGLVGVLDPANHALVLEHRGRLGDRPPRPRRARVGVSLLQRLGQGHESRGRERQHANAPQVSGGHRGVRPLHQGGALPGRRPQPDDAGMAAPRMAPLRPSISARKRGLRGS